MEQLLALMRRHLLAPAARIATAVRNPQNLELIASNFGSFRSTSGPLFAIFTPFLLTAQHSLSAIRSIEIPESITRLRQSFINETNFRQFIDKKTGYDSILQLKIAVDEASKAYDISNDAFKEAQRRYQTAVDSRAMLQRELQSLLARKATWSETEISIFTSLYKDEIRADSFEKDAKLAAECASRTVDATHALLVQAMKERYQGEQTWSDKIRALSTAGTFSLMALNIVIFLYMQMILEPKRRAALIRSIKEDSRHVVPSVLESQQEAFAVAVMEKLDRLDGILAEAAGSRSLREFQPTVAEVRAPMVEPQPFAINEYPKRALLFMAGSALVFLASRIGIIG